jgi:hypothetical protein
MLRSRCGTERRTEQPQRPRQEIGGSADAPEKLWRAARVDRVPLEASDADIFFGREAPTIEAIEPAWYERVCAPTIARDPWRLRFWLVP